MVRAGLMMIIMSITSPKCQISQYMVMLCALAEIQVDYKATQDLFPEEF